MSAAVPTHVAIHPLVLLSVVDHFSRVAKNSRNKRVLGVLLGHWLPDNSVDVANCYALPFEEDDKDPSVWFLDHNYHEAMYEMYKKINAREVVVGWYHSGPKLRQSDLEINTLFQKYVPNPVLVIVDVEPKDLGIPTSAYYAVQEIHDNGTATTFTFNHLPSSIAASEPEEVGVEQLLRDIKDNATGTLSSKITNQLESLKSLQYHLTEIQKYLAQVIAGKLPIHHSILYNLQDVFNYLPDLNKADLKRAFMIKTNDEMMVMYLSSLVRSVLALHSLIDNKLANHDAEKKADEESTTTPIAPTPVSSAGN